MSVTRSCSLSLRHAAAIVVLCCLAYRLDATETTLKVRYRSAQTIYLDAGSASGLTVGDRLEVVRGTEIVAQIDVIFVAEHSASCTIVEEQDFITTGDLARPSASLSTAPEGIELADSTPKIEDNDDRTSDLALSILEKIDNEHIQDGGDTVALVKETPGPQGDRTREFQIRYRSIDTVYIDGGRAAGLAVGDQLDVWQGGKVIATLSTALISKFSAACSVVTEEQGIQIGDLASPSELDVRASSSSEDSEDLAAIKQVIAAQSAELALAPSAVIPGRWQPPRAVRQRTTRVSGTVVLEFENFADESEGQKLDFQRLGARMSLRILDIGGHPYTLRVRARTQQNRRSLVGSANVPIAERRDRFYELSLAYDPPQGRFAYRVGRMSASPFVGIGYVDGFLGQMALTSSVEVGGFVGSSGDIDNFSFDTGRQKYGLFTRFTPSSTDSGLPWEVIMAGVREQGVTDVSREYVTLQSRFSGRGRFSFFQRTEVDVNRGWRKELSGKSAQVSNLSLVGTAQLSRFSRLSISYDRFEPYRTEESRPLPEEIFSAFLRQGWRASLYFGKPRGINFSLNAGLRDQEGEAEKTISYGLGVRYVDIASVGLTLGANFLGFSNPFNEGYVATFRASQPIPGGHLFDITLGNRTSSNVLFEDGDRNSYWARAGAWIQLPKRLFATTEYELGRGDDLQGQRLSLGLGYRF